MSLNWSLKDIANYETVCFETVEKPVTSPLKRKLKLVTETLIWATMAVGIGRLKTDEDCEQFYGRVALYEKLFGAMRYADHGETDVYFTLDEIKAHKGLSTNVSKETTAAWLKRIWEHFYRELPREATHAEAR